MRGLTPVAGLLFGMALTGPSLAAIAQPVKTEAGLVSGTTNADGSVVAFKSIPYAAPPVGDRRWRSPAAPLPWTGVRKAEKYGPICAAPSADPKAASEDCLTLNVWTGAATASAKQPVIVWIHVFLVGSGAEIDGEGLAKKGVTVVSINYRMGPFGFLATPELSQESGHAASGDFGIQDQIAALKWVQNNIAAFGGDPKRVTIAGSASQRGSSISFLAMSPQAKGLFQAAISGSQFPIPAAIDPPRQGPPPFELKVAEAAGQQYVASRGVKTLAELRTLATEQLLKGPEAGGPAAPGSNVRQVYQPVVDGYVIPLHYNAAEAGGRHLPGAFVVGNDANEGGARTDAAIAASRNAGPDTRGRAEPKLTLADYTAWARARFGGRYDQFIKLYPAADDDQAAHQNSAIIQDYARAASYFWAVGWTKAAGKPLYTFYWEHAPPSRGGQGAGGGAGHGSEIDYAFNNLTPDRPWTDQDSKIAEVMSSYWANIAKTGNPNGPGLPAWPAVDPKTATVMELGDRFGPMPAASPERVEFWRTFFLANQGG